MFIFQLFIIVICASLFGGVIVSAEEPGQVPIYIYSDFGGGQDQDKLISDWQTADELASAAWSSSKVPKLWINDSAAPLDPLQAAHVLGNTFPFENGSNLEIKKIVVHVIDPGVENDSVEHPRIVVLRKDGTVFVGPDNGTLSVACPPGSVEKVLRINPCISDVDFASGGTFHGRDLFLEVAVQLATGRIQLEEVGEPYKDLKTRFSNVDASCCPIQFKTVETSIWTRYWPVTDSATENIEHAFYLQVVQSPRLSHLKKLFWVQTDQQIEHIAIINHFTGNIYIGPNNGWGTSFYLGFPQEVVSIKNVPGEFLKTLSDRIDVNNLYQELLSFEKFEKSPIVFSFLERQQHLLYGQEEKPCAIFGRIWIDAYGNIKTSISSENFHKYWSKQDRLVVEINGVQQEVVWAESFAQVSEGQLFVYPGSSASAGINPKRSSRFIEISANGIYGAFGRDYFLRDSHHPTSGQPVFFWIGD